jgi:large subunit ribosomal protein L21
MYAIVKSGGKQYRVSEGDILRVEKLDAEPGAQIELDEVLMLVNGEDVRIGTPCVRGAKVSAQVMAHGFGPKIHIIKLKRRKHYRKQQGHRQAYTELSISRITPGSN